MSKSDVINFDFQGHPEYKMSLRSILQEFGFRSNDATGKFEISNDDPVLDSFPTRMIDDGMGYCVGKQKIISAKITSDNQIYILTEPELPSIDEWVEDGTFPTMPILVDNDVYFVSQLVAGEYELYESNNPEKIIYLPREKVKELL